ncbi:MAG: hypothetical protein JST54_28505 [Deltaproteobacteria bacterium]|nr:hypothetical protein [Deltaproteobacteria bacterium]
MEQALAVRSRSNHRQLEGLNCLDAPRVLDSIEPRRAHVEWAEVPAASAKAPRLSKLDDELLAAFADDVERAFIEDGPD